MSKIVIQLLLASLILTGSAAIKSFLLDEEKKNCAAGLHILEDNDRMHTLPKKAPTKIRIAFIGDSITKGIHASEDNDLWEEAKKKGYLKNGSKLGKKGYPYQIGKILESKGKASQFELLNFGNSGRRIMLTEDIKHLKHFDHSYDRTCDWQQVLKSEPNAVVFMLGTNDILHDPKDEQLETNIKKGFLKYTQQLKALSSRPTIYVMIPPPILKPETKSQYLSTQWYPNLIRELASQIPIPQDHIIDLQEVITADKAKDLLPDLVHPNDEGYKLIAQKVYETVIEDPNNKLELKDKLYKIGQDQ